MRTAVAALMAMSAALAGCAQITADLPIEGVAPDFVGITSWIGTEPLDWQALEGHVVLIDFWTYSCENCIRTLPHLTAWHAAYAGHGLVIIGVHSPEFEFEKDRANVENAMRQFGIEYPVAQDNDFATWRAWEQRYWPAKYLVDHEGNVRYHHFGEGKYAETEDAIRELLHAAGNELPARVEGDGGSGIRRADISPELYAGYWRQDWTLGNGDYRPDAWVNHEHDGKELVRDRIYLDGRWHHGEEALQAGANATAWLKFRSGPVNFVGDGDGCVEVWLDRAPLAPEGAADDVSHADGRPCVWLDGPRAYHVYGGPVGTHILELKPPEGFELYTFVFSSYDGGGPS